MPSHLPVVERAKPLLGTFVGVRVAGLAPTRAHAAIDAAFAAIAHIHRRMSFHDPASDVSRLNREAHMRAMRVDPATYAVIERALALSAASDGAFDIAVAMHLVAQGHLLPPSDPPEPDPESDWRDIELLEGNRVHFRRPLWIDLGGIAKGYAVDRAIAALQDCGTPQAAVNAGGDLRLLGSATERIGLRADSADPLAMPVVDLADAALASSERKAGGPHIDRRPAAAETPIFVAVAAPTCMDADALTKAVMMRKEASAALLGRCAAHAFVHDARGWREIGGRRR